MKTPSNFSAKRILLLINYEFQYLGKSLVLIFLGVLALLCAYLFIMSNGFLADYGQNGDFDHPIAINFYIIHRVIFLIYLLFGAMIVGTFSFREMNSVSLKQHFLSLPASISEKWLAKLIISTVITPVLLILNYYLDMNITNWLIWQAFGIDLAEYNLFEAFFQFPYFLVYFCVNGIFFWGSITFGKLSFFKTILAMVLAYFLLAILFLTVINFYLPELGDYWDIFELDFSKRLKDYKFKDDDHSFQMIPDTGWIMAGTIFSVVLVLMASSYFRLKEKQV